MTIPIQPGPFSFLAGAGQALGAYAEEKEKKRQTAVKEAQDKLNQMIKLRTEGYIMPEAFGTPQAMQLYNTLGITPVSTDKTSGESIEQGKRSYASQILPSLYGGQPSDEARSLIGAPDRGLTEKVNAGIAQNTAAVPIAQASVAPAQLTAATATAQIPGAGLTGEAAQQQTQDKTFNDMADRYIEGLYSRTKKLPSSGADAFQNALADPKQGRFAQAAGQSYFDQAIERMREKLSKEAIARQAANTRAQAAGPEAKDILKLQEDKVTRLNALIGKDKPSDEDYRNQGIAQLYSQKGQPVPPFLSGSVKRVEDYEQGQKELHQQINQAQTDYDRMASQFPTITPPRSSIGTSGSPEQRAAAAEYKARITNVKDPVQRKKIADEIAKKYGLTPQGAGGRF